MARSHSSEVTTLINSSGELITFAIEIANELNNSFSSVSTVDNGILHHLCKSNIVTGDLNLVYFDAMDIFSACNLMKAKFSVGPDGIASVVYKHLASCRGVYPILSRAQMSPLENRGGRDFHHLGGENKNIIVSGIKIKIS